MKTWRIWMVALGCGLSVGLLDGRASESGRSTYSPGSVIDFGAGVIPPVDGFFWRQDVWYSDVALRARAPGIDVRSDLTAWVTTTRLFWYTGLNWLGARHGAYLSVAYANTEAETLITMQTPDGGVLEERRDGESAGVSDLYLTPLSLSWDFGDWDVKWFETVVVPTGPYSTSEPVNVGRNHWALWSTLGTTYRRGVTGPELNLRFGYIVNDENEDTQYESGDELFVDGSLVWRANRMFKMGLNAAYYDQLTPDRGAGALLGDFEGQLVTVGPVAQFSGRLGGRYFSLTAKWLHDVEQDNHFGGDTVLLGYYMAL